MERLHRMSTFLYNLTTLKTFPVFLLYMAMVTFIPCLWKKYTKPIEIRSVLVLYNALCSLISLYTTYGMIQALYRVGIHNIYTNTTSHFIMPPLRLYGLTKMLELLDTVFMILRHKWRQISFLHVYHHSLMLLFIDYAVVYTPWVSMIPGCALNAFVHIILYLYYGYAAWFPENRPTWKKRITELQIVQFILDLTYCLYGLFYHQFCIWSFIYGLSMLYLFGNFYIKAYLLPQKKFKLENGHDGLDQHRKIRQ